MVIDIVKTEYLSGYKISFNFSDGIDGVIDFEQFLQSSKNPMPRKFLDLAKFRDFKIEYGDIIWNDYEMCFPVWDLHEGKL